MREKEYGIWQALSWADLAKLVNQLACGLHQAGLRRDEHMIVVGANRPRLYATMLAVQSLGAVPIPLYQDAAALECVFPINNADVRFAFAEDQEQVCYAPRKFRQWNPRYCRLNKVTCPTT